MIGLQGRPEITPTIEEVRELSLEEVRATPRVSNLPRVRALRDSHHMAARLCAMGLSNGEVAERSGYSYSGLSILLQDPAFKELVAHYRDVLTEEWKGTIDEYFTNLVGVRNKALRLISDKLDEAQPGEIPLNQLHAIQADAADRTGYPKRKETVNLNLDFADRLDAAVRRSREVKQLESPSAGVSVGASPPLLDPPPVGGDPLPEVLPSGARPRDGAEAGDEARPQAMPRPRIPREMLPEPRLKRRA